MDQRLVPVAAVLAVVVLAIMVVLFKRLVPPKRDIGEDFFGSEPRPTIPTEDEIEVPPNTLSDPVVAAAPMLAMAEPKPSRPVEPVESSGADKCRACREPMDVGAVHMEDWERVHSFWERLVGNGWLLPVAQSLGIVRPRQHGRELDQVLAGFCRSCATIAQPLRRAYRETQAVRRLAEDRQYEREGLPEAVRDVIVQERDRYKDEKMKRSRRTWSSE
jgi:hypothetical protein